MDKPPYVRTMLVDGKSNQYVKAIETLDLTDYIGLIRRQNDNSGVVFDFGIVIKDLHEALNDSLKYREAKELKALRDSTFHQWLRFRAAKAEQVKVPIGINFLGDSHRTLVRVHEAMRRAMADYRVANIYSERFGEYPEKYKKFNEFVPHAEALLEILLCNIHVTAVIDVGSFSADEVLGEQVDSIINALVECLKLETGWWADEFPWMSVINQCVMEDMKVNVPALLALMKLDITEDYIKRKHWESRTLVTDGDQRIWTCTWQKADTNVLDRVKVLAGLLQRFRALENLLSELKNNRYEYDGSGDATHRFEESIIAMVGHSATH